MGMRSRKKHSQFCHIYENHILYKTYEFHMKYISRVGMEAHDHQNMQFFLTCIFRSLNVSLMSYILFSSKTWPIVVLMAAILNFAKKNCPPYPQRVVKGD